MYLYLGHGKPNIFEDGNFEICILSFWQCRSVDNGLEIEIL